MSRVRAALAVGLVLIAVILGITLSGSPITVARVNGASNLSVATITRRTTVCQPGEILPRGTSAIRLRAFALAGPPLALSVSANGREIAHGKQRAGWTGGAVTVPVSALSTTRSGASLCFTLFLNGHETVYLTGESTPEALAARANGGTLPGRVLAEYLRPGRSSWLSLAPEVARRMGLGRAWSGGWVAILVVLLMTGVLALCSRLVLKELG